MISLEMRSVTTISPEPAMMCVIYGNSDRLNTTSYQFEAEQIARWLKMVFSNKTIRELKEQL